MMSDIPTNGDESWFKETATNIRSNSKQVSNASIKSVLEPIYVAETIGEARDRLGKLLGLANPATTAVTLRVLADSTYAEKLASVRKFPAWRDRLLAEPKNEAFAPPDRPLDEDEVNARPVTSTVALVKKSSAALLRWAAAGFKKTEPEIVEQRKTACLSCDQLVEPPSSFPYEVTKVFSDGDRRICAACGCVVAKKILMATETCPLADIEDKDRTRWGDIIER
ncbi:MAG: hypothetical protein AAF974_04130 [Cyanobacteria bacterium P01_E01_bin.34]